MSQRIKVTLRNNFHNSEAIVIAIDNLVSKRAYHRAERKLCGSSDCLCGGVRGPQHVDGKRFDFVALTSESYLIAWHN